jgi:hypothetical protein
VLHVFLQFCSQPRFTSYLSITTDIAKDQNNTYLTYIHVNMYTLTFVLFCMYTYASFPILTELYDLLYYLQADEENFRPLSDCLLLAGFFLIKEVFSQIFVLLFSMVNFNFYNKMRRA